MTFPPEVPILNLLIVVVGGFSTFAVFVLAGKHGIPLARNLVLFGIAAVLGGAAYASLFGASFVDVVLLRNTFGPGRTALGGYAFLIAGCCIFLYSIVKSRLGAQGSRNNPNENSL